MRRADEAFGQVDVLVNAAAITDRGTLIDTSPELYDRMFAVNTRAPFFLMQDAAKIMIRERLEGTMVNILSMSAHGGQPFIIAYSGSKGALLTLTKNAAFSLLRNRIRVNGLTIGWMDTPGEHRIQKLYHAAADDWLAKAEAVQPAGRLLKPEEVARAVAYLASDESGMMTGSIIDFDQQVLGSNETAAKRSEALTIATR
jgi:NAD(P)-dependent dehydrogenase (short-subunit alcohol dehydrogenase family)